jgi:hypothetical protein
MRLFESVYNSGQHDVRGGIINLMIENIETGASVN